MRSAKPSSLASRKSCSGTGWIVRDSSLCMPTTSAMACRNHLSIFDSSWISSTEMPFFSACATAKMRSGVAFLIWSFTSSNTNASGSRPRTPMSSMRSAFWITSGKVRPMAITSPTLFISLPMRNDAPLNLFKSQRGTLHTR
jgi:hypothetical protein